MKQGRPNIRQPIQKLILDVLYSSQTPLTTSVITRLVSESFGRKISWNTVQKYLHELIQGGKIQVINLPHSKEENKNGLTVYIVKK